MRYISATFIILAFCAAVLPFKLIAGVNFNFMDILCTLMQPGHVKYARSWFIPLIVYETKII